jgi:subtilisin
VIAVRTHSRSSEDVARWSRLASLTVIAAALAIPAGASASERDPDATVIDGSYIVVYEQRVGEPGAATDRRERGLRFRAEHRYSSPAIKGFAAKLSDEQVETLESDPQVDFVSENRRVSIAGWVRFAGSEPPPPTGIRRIWAARGAKFVREASQVNVAVIDTGVRRNHPDLNVRDGRNCIDAPAPQQDGNGHGTHVAGTIGAKNNGNPAGVVGVAPETVIYGVKVLDDDGSGTWAEVICGINWVSNQAADRNIGVANMSLGGLGPPVEACDTTTDALHKAICRSTRVEGVNYVVAAGNSGWDYDYPPVPDIPAAYPEVLTVTAMSDSDGKPGGAGSPPACSRREGDDVRASFSNYVGNDAVTDASAHTIAAPGVCIASTWKGDPDYHTISGTSMAAPHVAGMVALCIGEVGHEPGPCAGRTTKGVIKVMLKRAARYNSNHPDYGFLRDPLHSPVAGEHYGFLGRTLPPRAVAP